MVVVVYFLWTYIFLSRTFQKTLIMIWWHLISTFIFRGQVCLDHFGKHLYDLVTFNIYIYLLFVYLTLIFLSSSSFVELVSSSFWRLFWKTLLSFSDLHNILYYIHHLCLVLFQSFQKSSLNNLYGLEIFWSSYISAVYKDVSIFYPHCCLSSVLRNRYLILLPPIYKSIFELMVTAWSKEMDFTAQ